MQENPVAALAVDATLDIQASNICERCARSIFLSGCANRMLINYPRKYAPTLSPLAGLKVRVRRDTESDCYL